MSPYYETKLNPKSGTSETIRRLKPGDSVTLYGNDRSPVGVKLSIIDDEQAKLEVHQRDLNVATGELGIDGVTISFCDKIVPEVINKVVIRKSVCTYGNRAGRRRVVWQSE